MTGEPARTVALDYGGYPAALRLPQWYPKDRQMPRGPFKVLAGRHGFLVGDQGHLGG